MELPHIAIRAGDLAFTWAEILTAIGGLVILLLVLIAVLAWRAGRSHQGGEIDAQRRSGELELQLAEMAGQLRQFAEATSVRDAHLTRTLDERLDTVGHRLGQGLTETTERTDQSLQQLHERLAVIDTAQANITALSSEMISLKDILSNKQARGAYGQGRMEAIIRDGLHSSAYEFQATLSNNTRPDCLIRLPESELKVVIDAKFPLEAFNAHKAAETQESLKHAEQQLRRDMGQHIKDISQKYLIAGETHETAVMFVPSESIYADLHEHFEDVIQKAHRAQVIITSPNILMLLIQTMQAIFKDARMREQAGHIQTEVVRLLDDVERMRLRMIDLRRHFELANKDIEKLETSSDKITRRGNKIEQLELKEEVGQVETVEQQTPKLVVSQWPT